MVVDIALENDARLAAHLSCVDDEEVKEVLPSAKVAILHFCFGPHQETQPVLLPRVNDDRKHGDPEKQDEESPSELSGPSLHD